MYANEGKQVTVKELTELLEELAPPRLALEWDNVGLLLGRSSRPVRRLLLALDLTAEVARQALQQEADMLVTHHPVIFKRLGSLTDADWQQELLLQLAEQGVAVYSAHTNLDCVANGVNRSLAARLKLQDVFELDTASGLGRIGHLEQSFAHVRDFAAYAKKVLQADYTVYGDAGRPVRRVAVCGGAGSELIDLALDKGADTLLTGDVKYHEAQRAVFSGLNIVDAGHQATELPVLEDLADRLSLRFTEREWPITVTIAKETLLLRGV